MPRYLHAALLCLSTSMACGGGPVADLAPPSSNDGGAGASDASDEGARKADPVPSEWQRVQGSCGVSMQAPALVTQPVRGIDSCVATFVAPGCTYSADVGGFSDKLTEYRAPDHSVESVRVDGRVARLVTSIGAPGASPYFVGIHFPAPLWSGAEMVSATVTAYCNTPAAQDTARLVLQSLELPADSGATALQPTETANCNGEDVRPVTGYRLGRSCVEGKVEVPGTCALGAKINGATGNGPMVCFVSKAGDYYWAFVAYGETLGGTGSRHGSGEAIEASQLEVAEEEKCRALMSLLGKGEKPLLGGELSYQICP